MTPVPFKAEHLLKLQLQDGQLASGTSITKEYARMLEGQWAFTAMVDNEPVAVAGVTEIWENRGLVWSFMGRNAGPHFVAIHKAALRLLSLVPYRRLEADTPCGFEQGHRWLRMLGFTMEAERMRAYLPGGGDSSLYARVNHG